MYRIERMIVQLKNTDVFKELAGFIFGTCVNCTQLPYSDSDIETILSTYIKDIPAYSGAMIGHQNKTFTIPIGTKVEMDADKGTIRLLDSAVAIKKS